jgi:cytochrome c556
MKKLICVGSFAIVLVSAALAHDGHEHATGFVKERMITMTNLGERLLAISKRLRANKDLDRISDDARIVHELAGKILDQFPPGSTQWPTAAKPVIWQDWATFESSAKKLQAEADKLAKTNPADGNALRAQFRAVAFTCDGCHEKHRIPNPK